MTFEWIEHNMVVNHIPYATGTWDKVPCLITWLSDTGVFVIHRVGTQPEVLQDAADVLRTRKSKLLGITKACPGPKVTLPVCLEVWMGRP
jgi:hypothetical protein